jgi:hypothetical protein
VSYEEKRTWIYLVTSAGAYAVYLALVIPRLGHAPVGHVPYVATLFWTTIASIVASVVGGMLFQGPRADRRADVRDREINRFGEYTTRWFVVGGAAIGMLMAMARWDHFWIANVIYLGFVLWAVVGSAVKLVAYRRGL